MPKRASNEPFGFASHPVASRKGKQTEDQEASDPQVQTEVEYEVQVVQGWTAVDDSGTQVDLEAAHLSDPRMSPAADRILYDDDDNVVGVFPANWAVFKNEEAEEA